MLVLNFNVKHKFLYWLLLTVKDFLNVIERFYKINDPKDFFPLDSKTDNSASQRNINK